MKGGDPGGVRVQVQDERIDAIDVVTTVPWIDLKRDATTHRRRPQVPFRILQQGGDAGVVPYTRHRRLCAADADRHLTIKTLSNPIQLRRLIYESIDGPSSSRASLPSRQVARR